MDRRRSLRNWKQEDTRQNVEDEINETTNNGLVTEPRKNQHGTSKTTNGGLRKRTWTSTQQSTDDKTSETTNDCLETEPRKKQYSTSKTTNGRLRNLKQAVTKQNTDDETSETTNDGLQSLKQAATQPDSDDETSETTDDRFETELQKNLPGTSGTTGDGSKTEPQNYQHGACEMETYNLENEPKYDQPKSRFCWTTEHTLTLLEAMINRKPTG